MVSVKVIYTSSGKPATAQKVSIGFEGFFRGFSETQLTDNQGETHFNNDPGNGTIYINGKAVFKGLVAGMKGEYSKNCASFICTSRPLS